MHHHAHFNQFVLVCVFGDVATALTVNILFICLVGGGGVVKLPAAFRSGNVGRLEVKLFLCHFFTDQALHCILRCLCGGKYIMLMNKVIYFLHFLPMNITFWVHCPLYCGEWLHVHVSWELCCWGH